MPGALPTAEKCAGDELRRIMSHAPGYSAKAVGNWLDIWGDHTMHDWPYWLRMAEKYF